VVTIVLVLIVDHPPALIEVGKEVRCASSRTVAPPNFGLSVRRLAVMAAAADGRSATTRRVDLDGCFATANGRRFEPSDLGDA
jgi:hypothetical protein